jgi:DNA-binding NtrC family response regulator
MSEKTGILLVDDEAPLLRLMQTYLERVGYRVESFETAAAALDRFRAAPESFRVAVTDLSLAGMPGDDLGLELMRINPDICVVICSGYPFEVEGLPEHVRGRFAHLQKPFLPKMLCERIEEMLRAGA